MRNISYLKTPSVFHVSAWKTALQRVKFKMSQTANILIVDDNKSNLLSLRTLIEGRFDNVNVIEADSGITALSLLIKKTVNLILLDIQMPHMDGFETARIVQSRPKTRHIPIVFLTAAFKSEEFKKKGYEVGAVDYLTKPIEPNQLTHKIQLYLRFIQQKCQYNEQEIDKKVQERIAGFSDKPLDSKQIENLSQKLRSSLNTIVAYTGVVEKTAIESGYQNIISEIEVINFEGKQMLDLINEVLGALK